ncbi:MAG: GNAT family N-acetyltransferase [Pseudomonadota bacterium]
MTRDLPAAPCVASDVTSEVVAGFGDVPRRDWRALYGAAADGPDYYLACERAPLDAFTYRAVAARGTEGTLMAAPVFEAAFRYDMSWDGPLRRITDALHARVPKLVALPVLGMGSPHADELALGVHDQLDATDRAGAFTAMLNALEADACRRGIEVLFLKDVTDTQAAWIDPLCRARGYARLPTLPVAHLKLTGTSEDDYVASLSQNMRSNLRRKLKRAGDIEIEVRTDPSGLDEELQQMRAATQHQAGANYQEFEGLAPGFYDAVLAQLPDRARIIFYRADGQLLGFALVLLDDARLTYKYTGMRYPEARDRNLYFVNWMTMVRMCFERGLRHLHAGETTYLTKSRLGCTVERSWIYFKHTNRVVNPLFKLIGPRIRIDRMDPDVREMGDAMPYAPARHAPLGS